jgi:1,5-anhydro-D-fructose reductase (1,5-anhydro-D-mannitol-forming)
MFGFNHRHHESVIYTKKLIDSGEYGDILWMRGRYGKSVDTNFFSTWRAKKELAGGGIFLDQGIHMLDLFLMLCGDFEEVHALVSNLYWKLDIEDNVFAMFRNKKGQAASLHSTMTQWRHLFSLEIFLSRGYITINGLKTSSNTYGDEAMSIAKNRSAPPAAIWDKEEDMIFHVDNSWRRELEIFIDSIEKQTPVPVGNSGDALKLMRLVEEVYKQK